MIAYLNTYPTLDGASAMQRSRSVEREGRSHANEHQAVTGRAAPCWTDVGVAKLKTLPKLKRLWLFGTKATVTEPLVTTANVKPDSAIK